jgi:L-threonylcarbamoyladenylate synthase
MSAAPILSPTETNLKNAARLIRSGGVVGYPTETVYGFGVDPFSEAALDHLFAIKGRPPDQPVLLLIADREEAHMLSPSVSPIASDLMDRFWPGPLTLILPAREGLSTYITSGSGTVALRLASPGTAFDLLTETGSPITSTSANCSGEAPATTSEGASAILPQDALVLDGHCESTALPSTIVDTTGSTPCIVRNGAIPPTQILT